MCDKRYRYKTPHVAAQVSKLLALKLRPDDGETLHDWMRTKAAGTARHGSVCQAMRSGFVDHG